MLNIFLFFNQLVVRASWSGIVNSVFAWHEVDGPQADLVRLRVSKEKCRKKKSRAHSIWLVALENYCKGSLTE